jgi:hypothetical protein
MQGGKLTCPLFLPVEDKNRGQPILATPFPFSKKNKFLVSSRGVDSRASLAVSDMVKL